MPKNQPSAKFFQRKISLYAAGIVAPGASNLNEFISVIRAGKSVLSPKKSLLDAFLCGTPKFNFEKYHPWLSERHGPKRYSQLNEKQGDLVKYGVGSMIDAVTMHPNLEKTIKLLDDKVYVQYVTGLADLPVAFQASRELDKTTAIWNQFWSEPQNNSVFADFLAKKISIENLPPDPEHFSSNSYDRFEAIKTWNAFWAPKSPRLHEYMAELKDIEKDGVVGDDIEKAKLNLIRVKARRRRDLAEKYKAPIPPWDGVSPNLLWNVPNMTAAQTTMLLGIHGKAIGGSGACGSFGTVLDNALLEINSGRYDMAIVGVVDAAPSDELICSFFGGRLAVLGDQQGVPFCDLRGTHVSGGACTWIIAAEDVMQKYDVPSLGVEILGTAVSSDAEHIITPSTEGPKLAIRNAIVDSGINCKDLNLWDMHATGTPGDCNEFNLIEEFVPKSAYISARKGILGHGMSTCGGWELTAQVLAISPSENENEVILPPSGIPKKQVHPKISSLERNLLLDQAVTTKITDDGLICGKLGMGVGGVSSCVITRVLKKAIRHKFPE